MQRNTVSKILVFVLTAPQSPSHGRRPDHTHKGERGWGGSWLCLCNPRHKFPKTHNGPLEAARKRRIHIVGDCTTGWRVGGALWKLSVGVEDEGGWALCVYWEVPTVRAWRLDVHKSSVSVSLHTPHTPLTPRLGRQDPPRFHFRVKSRREAVSQNTKV